MPRRKRSAWGNLTKIDSQTWRLRYWSTGPDGYKRRSKTIRNATRLEAERVRSELMLAHSDDAPCPTVGEVWDSYALPDLERRVASGDVAASTLKQYRYAWQKHVDGQWSRVQCDSVRALAVQQWLYGLPLNAARSGLGLLRLVLDYAVRYELVGHNVARERYLMPSPSTTERRDRGTWTLDQLGEVWRIVHGRWMEGAFLLCAFGGLRVSEALAVQTDAVTLTDVGGVPIALVRVERQMGDHGVTDALKTPQSRRTVAIPGLAATRLATIAAESVGYVSGDGMGGPSTRFRLRKAWDALPLGELRHPFRNLRNSWQTNARWSLRIPPHLLEPMMGHAGRDVTGQYYDRPQAEMFAEVVAEAYRQRPYDDGWQLS